MITDIQVQHELLKTALEATDNYLFVEKRAVAAGTASTDMIHTFTYEMARAHDALQALGVLDQHQPYMATHTATMVRLHGHPDQDVMNQPYSHVPASDYGEVEESKEFWDSAKERADEPKEKLSPAWKAKAKARAAAAGRKYPNMVDNVWAAQKQESVVTSFANFIAEKKEQFSEDDINEMVDSLKWEDVVDLYPEEDFCLFKNFPHSKLVVPKINTKPDLQCTCTLLWLIQYKSLYQEGALNYLDTPSVSKCLDDPNFEALVNNCNFELKIQTQCLGETSTTSTSTVSNAENR
jgi:hypothetical protein